MTSAGDITLLLTRISSGDRSAEDELLPRVYQELRRQAQRYLRHERPEHSLQATDLVHEVYIRLTGNQEGEWNSRSHFFAVAARIMRRILTDHARQNHAAKRGGGLPKFSLDETIRIGSPQPDGVLAQLDEAMLRLAKFSPRQAQIVEMRFFGGMTEDEIAHVLQLSVRTVKRDWSVAKAWLYGELNSSS
jgi:RNA polymerase sigma-70 factor (ECF subfamily)